MTVEEKYPLASMKTSADCLEAIAQIDQGQGRIKRQITDAQIEAHVTGVRADDKWLRAAQTAAACMGNHRLRLQTLAAKFGKEERAVRAKQADDSFIHFARQRLTPEVFGELFDAWLEETGAAT